MSNNCEIYKDYFINSKIPDKKMCELISTLQTETNNKLVKNLHLNKIKYITIDNENLSFSIIKPKLFSKFKKVFNKQYILFDINLFINLKDTIKYNKINYTNIHKHKTSEFNNNLYGLVSKNINVLSKYKGIYLCPKIKLHRKIIEIMKITFRKRTWKRMF